MDQLNLKRLNKAGKISLYILGGIAVIILILYILSVVAEQKIKSGIEESFSENLQYEEIDVDIYNRSVKLTTPEISTAKLSVMAEEINIEGLGIYQYVANNKLRIGRIEITDPEIVVRTKEEDTTDTSGSAGKFEQDILVEELEVSNGRFRMVESDSTEDKLFLAFENFGISDLAVNSETVENKIPFEYDSYEFQGDSLKTRFDGQHDLSMGPISMSDGQLRLNQIRITPLYDKVEFQRHIPYEKDRIVLLVEEVSLEDFDWGFSGDSLRLESSLLSVQGADLEIYRNKLVADDPRTKALYSQQIRNMSAKIDFPEVEVTDSKIVYEEKMREAHPPGVISFTELNGTIENITNIEMDRENFPETVVHAEALFMNEAPLEVDWSFDISNQRDAFEISGNLGYVSSEGINSFVRSAMNVEARGGITSLAFDYAGDDDAATGDVRIVYEDFKINVLKDEGEETSGFWSALANLFINNDAVNDDVYHEDLEVTRDKKKSFWNYLWLMVREGALSAFI